MKMLAAQLALSVALTVVASAGRISIWGSPPREKPHFGKSAQSKAPAPLPGVPERRSEKKRPPAPPRLIANLHNFSFDGWQGSPGSVDSLLRTTQAKVELWYGWEHLDLKQVVRKHHADVQTRTPILYLCAYYPLDFNEDQRAALKDYVLEGGTLLINCCGQEPSYKSAQEEMKLLFPKRPLRRLPMDHPIYSANYKVEWVQFPMMGPATPFVADPTAPREEGDGLDLSGRNTPQLRAVTLGTRAAVIVSFEDLACGWNQWDNPHIKRYAPKDSNRLGINILTYVMAEMRLAKFLARTRQIKGPNVRPRQQLTVAQLIHDGNWDPNPSALPFLLKDLAANTEIAVDFQPRQFELRNPELFAHPLLYMTGTWDPNLNRAEIVLLRRHLQQGGILIADAASGRHEFNDAFHALADKLFPGRPLQRLAPEHPLFNSFHQIDTLDTNHLEDPTEPAVEAVFLGERPVILYSPMGLSDGWSQRYSAFARAYLTRDAVKLGANLIVYAMQ